MGATIRLILPVLLLLSPCLARAEWCFKGTVAGRSGTMCFPSEAACKSERLRGMAKQADYGARSQVELCREAGGAGPGPTSPPAAANPLAESLMDSIADSLPAPEAPKDLDAGDALLGLERGRQRVRQSRSRSATLEAAFNQLDDLSDDAFLDEPGAASGVEIARPRCQGLDTLLERDKRSLRDHGRHIEQALSQLDEWSKKNERAQQDALDSATGFLADSLMAKLGEFNKGQLEKIEAELKRLPKKPGWWTPPDMSALYRQREKLQRVADGLDVVGRHSGTAKETYEFFKGKSDEATASVTSLESLLESAGADRDVRAVFETYGVFVKAPWREVAKKLPGGEIVAFADFLINYSYSAKEWADSRKMILQRNRLTEDQLEAAHSLKCQIECTVRKRKQCEAGQAPTACPERPKGGQRCSS